MTQQARTGPDPDRNLALELVRATEAAAIGGARHLGRGDKEAVDQAAVDAMRPVLGQIAMDGVVVIGEGEKDNAPMLYNGERVGDGSPPQVDIAVDPVDGTTLTAKSLPNAIGMSRIASDIAMSLGVRSARPAAGAGAGAGAAGSAGSTHPLLTMSLTRDFAAVRM